MQGTALKEFQQNLLKIIETTYYRHLSAVIKMKIVCNTRDFSVWLRISSVTANINQFQSHTGKCLKLKKDHHHQTHLSF